jgi:hypothetical protein
MPTQPLLSAAALVDDIVAVIDEQLDLPIHALIRPRPAQVRLPQRRPRDRQCVDRVRLSACPACPSLGDGELRRHPHEILTGTQELLLEPASQLPAILHRPQPPARKRRCPPQQRVASNLDHRLVKRPSRFVDGHRGH